MNKLIYLCLLLLLFLFSLNTKLMLISIFCFVGICIYFKKKELLIFGLIILYVISIFNNNYESFQNPTGSTSTILNPTGSTSTILNPTGSTSTTLTCPTIPLSTEPTSSLNVKDRYDYQYIEPDEYGKITHVLKSLLNEEYLESNRESIDEIIINNSGITNIFTLSDAILNINNETKYNNFLEKITCIKCNKVNYLDCDNINYKKLRAFSELIKIYTFPLDYVLYLINEHKIYKLCDVETYLNSENNKRKYGYEYDGYMVYINKLSINNKYFKLLELLELDKLLNNKNTNIPLKERLYNYVDKNNKISKDLNSIVVLFHHYKILDDIRINNEEDDYNWDYSLLRNIDLNRNYWSDNPIFNEYKIKELIIKKINELTKEDKNIFRHELNKKFDPKTDNNNDNDNDNELEYKTINNTKNKESIEFLEKLNLKNIKTNFSKVFLDIINELINLYKHKCTNECVDYGNEYVNSIIYYLHNSIKILIKEGRMFYVGIFVIFLSFMLYFIEVSK